MQSICVFLCCCLYLGHGELKKRIDCNRSALDILQHSSSRFIIRIVGRPIIHQWQQFITFLDVFYIALGAEGGEERQFKQVDNNVVD